MQLELPKVLAGRGVRGALQKCRKALAAVDVASLRVRPQLARVHVLDHALAQRRDSIRAHKELLSRVRLKASRSSRQDAAPAMGDLSSGDNAHGWAPAQRAIAQRFSALAHCYTLRCALPILVSCGERLGS